MLRLARECGLHTAESRIETVGGKDVLLVKRFDREKTPKGYTRARMVSGLTLLRADEAPKARQNWSYIILVEELRRSVDGAEKRCQRTVPPHLLQRADLEHRRSSAQSRDHREGDESGSSPRPTISRPQRRVSQEHRDLAMECGDQGRYANAKNILSQHARFLLERDEAERIVNDMKAQVEATWYETLRASGVSEKDAETIRGAFVYPGFSL